MSDIPNRIKLARKSAGLSQAQLAEKIGSERVSVSRWETGKSNPSVYVLVSIGHATGHTPGWLSSGQEPRFLDKVSENVIPYQAPQPSFDQALMESAMLAVLQLLQQRRLKLSPERTVAGILSVYEAAKAQGRAEVTEADVTPLVRLLMA